MFEDFPVVYSPTRRLGKKEETKKRENGEEDLECERKSELSLAADKAHTVIDPVGGHDTEDVNGQLDGETLASLFCLHQFRMPDRCLA